MLSAVIVVGILSVAISEQFSCLFLYFFFFFYFEYLLYFICRALVESNKKMQSYDIATAKLVNGMGVRTLARLVSNFEANDYSLRVSMTGHHERRYKYVFANFYLSFAISNICPPPSCRQKNICNNRD